MELTQENINKFIIKFFGEEHKNMNLNQEVIEHFLLPEKNYKILGIYGFGVSATVFRVINIDTNKEYAVRVVRLTNENVNNLRNEVAIQDRLSNYGLAPVILNHWEGGQFYDGFYFFRIIMDTIDVTLDEYIKNNPRKLKQLYKPLECLIIKKYILDYPNSILHGDMITNNIAILNDKQTLGFIDFGWSTKAPSVLQLLDCICLVNALKGYNTRETQDFARYIIKLYNKMFNVKLEYDNFIQVEVLNYAYSTNISTNRYLHSYRIPNYVIENNPTLKGVKSFISPEDLFQVFPEITPPTVDNV